MAVPWPPKRERLAAGALAPALGRWETLDQGLRLPTRGLKPRRGAARGLPFEAPVGKPCSLWGKFFDNVILILLFLCVYSYNGLPYAHFSFRLKQTLEQAQPSMAKRLKRPPRIQVGCLFPLLRDLCCSHVNHHND